tara:strand:+ start:489 stop:659 length:171 start_codon:yes stop_codon:yes gene_type:complete
MRSKDNAERTLTTCIGITVAIAVATGVALDNYGLGIGIGAAIGAAFYVARKGKGAR